MAMYVLHFTPDTAAFAVRVLLQDLGLPHEARLIDREGGALQSAAYRAMQPLGKIPALETPDGVMFETAAILLWLADRHAPGRLAPAHDSAERAAFLSWFFFTSTNLHPAVLDLHYTDRVGGPDATPMVLPHVAARARAALTALEAKAATAPGWLAPDRPTLLALYLGMLMRWLGQLPTDHPAQFPVSDYPALQAALTVTEAWPAVLKVAAAEDMGATVFTNPHR